MDDIKTALDSIEAALQEAYDGNVSPGVDDSTLREALALIPALREQLTPGEDVQGALMEMIAESHLDNLSDDDYKVYLIPWFHKHYKTILKALQKTQAVDVAEWAKFITRGGEFYGDHACVECHPYSEMVIEGFQCVLHEAQALLQGCLTQPTEDKT